MIDYKCSESLFEQLSRNKVVLASFSAWALAQSLKVLFGYIREKRFNFKWFVGSGGMPSSHTALASCLATCIGIDNGFNSGIFAVTMVFAVIIMFDAQGVRRQSGHQAEVLNKIIEDLYAHKGLQEARLIELFGHTPVEVFAGAFVGIFMALLFHY